MSDIEKTSVRAPSHESLPDHHAGGLHDLPPDPDAHLSPEEREKVVSNALRMRWSLRSEDDADVRTRTASFSGD
jgi:hypothetical protein